MKTIINSKFFGLLAAIAFMSSIILLASSEDSIISMIVGFVLLFSSLASLFVETEEAKSTHAVNAALSGYKKARGDNADLFTHYMTLKAAHFAAYPKAI